MLTDLSPRDVDPRLILRNLRNLVYYAHPLSLYGTPIEKRDVTMLVSMGFDVINPNCQTFEEGYKREGMEYFRKFVEKANVLAFRAFPDGSIPAGIAQEIQMAEAAKIPVFELPCGIKRRALSVEATREYLQDVGKR